MEYIVNVKTKTTTGRVKINNTFCKFISIILFCNNMNEKVVFSKHKTIFKITLVAILAAINLKVGDTRD